jgi:alkanesulfonate monooxygenase SsuD/methylene tetrahydromethanopterin reductase-like flavin-dependent oxidoreductase (luciferase family)
MKATLFSRVPYLGPAPRGGWPVSVEAFSPEQAAQSIEASYEQFELADELGFDWITLAEHHYAPLSMTPNPTVMAGALAQRVRRAKIALLGANISILNPVRVAEEYAMVDVLTGGRLVAGMLRGTVTEYVTYGTNPAESRERFEEALQLIIRAWTEPQPFGWQGRYYEYRTISIWPRPLQRPYPPIYMSGSSPESRELAARHRVGLGLAYNPLPLARQAVQHYREQAALAGWEATPDHLICRIPIHLAESDAQALEEIAAAPPIAIAGAYAPGGGAVEAAVMSAGYHGRDLSKQRARSRAGSLEHRIEIGTLLAGSPETVLKQLRTIHDEVGFGIVDLNFLAVSRDGIMRALELFGTRVLPVIHEWGLGGEFRTEPVASPRVAGVGARG